ncbi:hypothetical protein ACLOJK_029078 [Asimina triloba]
MRIHSSFPLVEFFSGRMVWVLSSCWISAVNFLFSTFGYLIKYLFRYGTQNGSEKEESSSIPGKGDGYADSFDSSSVGSNGEPKDKDSEEKSSTANVLKYRFLAQKDFTGFVDEPQVTNFSIKESFVDWKSDEAEVDDRSNAEAEEGFMSKEDFHQELSKTEELGHGEVCRETTSSEACGREVESEKSEVVSIGEDRLSSDDRFIELNIERLSDFQVESIASVERGIRDLDSYDFLSVDHEDDSSNSDIESTGSNTGFPSDNNQTDCFKSEIEDESRQLDEEEIELIEEQQQQIMKEAISPTETEELDCSSATEPADELHQTNKTHFENISNSPAEVSERPEAAAHLENSLDSDGEEDSDGMEALWEHEDLVDQLRMELKKVRGTTLPTILEESESPRSVVEDLKPWKMEEEQQLQQQQEDPMEELQKFHERYREKMKKLDVLNYQKMHAMGFLQRKDHQLPSIVSQKTSSFRLLRRRKSDMSDHSAQFARELECDLETIYVGQTCLSWELLHWQYLRSCDLPEFDARGRRRQYNLAAGELQQFQVLLQRFVENEEFQGPRIRYYIQSRCVLRNLLQVPLIKVEKSTSWVNLVDYVSSTFHMGRWPLYVDQNHMILPCLLSSPLSDCVCF